MWVAPIVLAAAGAACSGDEGDGGPSSSAPSCDAACGKMSDICSYESTSACDSGCLNVENNAIGKSCDAEFEAYLSCCTDSNSRSDTLCITTNDLEDVFGETCDYLCGAEGDALSACVNPGGTGGSGGAGTGGGGGTAGNTGDCGPRGATGYCLCQTFGTETFSGDGEPCKAAGGPAFDCAVIDGMDYSVQCHNSSCLWEVISMCTNGCNPGLDGCAG